MCVAHAQRRSRNVSMHISIHIRYWDRIDKFNGRGGNGGTSATIDCGSGYKITGMKHAAYGCRRNSLCICACICACMLARVRVCARTHTCAAASFYPEAILLQVTRILLLHNCTDMSEPIALVLALKRHPYAPCSPITSLLLHSPAANLSIDSSFFEGIFK